MSLKEYAQTELKLAGMFDKDSDYNGELGNAVMELVEVFCKQGHSGNSANMVLNLFNKVARWQPLLPITGKDEEWGEITAGGPIKYQNIRNSAIFKDTKDSQAYYLDAILWRNQNGCTYTGRASGIRCAQYIKNFPFIAKTFIIDVNEVEVDKDCWEFYIKDMKDLDQVWEYYDKKDILKC